MAMDTAREAAHAVSEFLQGNPFSTRVGQQIEQATDTSLASENWALNMEICDMINHTDEGPRDAIRAIRKRLQTTIGKNNQSAMYTLTVLETCVKNCDYRLHQLVSQKEFVQELVKLIGPKYDPPQIVQEKVLGLIQAWAHAFRGKPGLNSVCEMYDELKSKGLEFPVLDPNAAPIFVSGLPEHQQHPTPMSTVASAHATMPIQAMAIPLVEPVNPSPEQLAKLRSELDTVANNLKVLREMLTELAPGQEAADDLQLLQELNATCRQMQARVLELLERVSNEEVTSELLLLNDELNNVFAKYDRYMANRRKESEQRSQTTSGNAGGIDSGALIDFGGSSNDKGQTTSVGDLSQNMSGMNKFLSFGLSQVLAVSGAPAASQHPPTSQGGAPLPVKESDAKEMEAWLKQSGSAGGGQSENQEFQQFLNQRAEAGSTAAPPQ